MENTNNTNVLMKQDNTDTDNPYQLSKSLAGTSEVDSSKRMARYARRRTGRVLEASQSRTAVLDGIMEALKSGHYNTIGVLGPESAETADLLEKVSRRAKRDNLFHSTVRATVSREPNYRRIQDEIAEALGLKFDDEEGAVKRSSISVRVAGALGLKSDDHDDKDLVERAEKLRERILMEQNILVTLTDLCKDFDLDKVGIPFGEDHRGCKLLMTSATEEVFSKEMLVQKLFKL